MKTKTRLLAIPLIFWALAGCGTTPAAPQATETPVVIVPTVASAASATPSSPPATPGCPNPDCIYVTPPPSTPEPLRFNLPTPGVEPVSAWRPPQYPVPLSLGPFDHFYFARPIGADEVNWPIADYRYGGTFLSAKVTHTGVDIPAQAGTPVLAAGPGTVVWAGWGLFSGTPDNIYDPYGMAVAIRHDFGYHGQPLYTIYAHMSEVDVAVGEWVNTGQHIGNVGDTGYTTGPHLHLEVRIGENSYYMTRNPELWIAPPQGWGVLAARIMDNEGKLSNSTQVFIDSLSSKREWVVNTYGPGPANPDAYYNENMVISDLPGGDYSVKMVIDGKAYQLKVKILPGRVTFFSFRGTRGFSTTPPPTPSIFGPTPTP